VKATSSGNPGSSNSEQFFPFAQNILAKCLDNAPDDGQTLCMKTFIVFRLGRDRRGRPLWYRSFMSSNFGHIKQGINPKKPTLIAVERFGLTWILARIDGFGSTPLPFMSIPWYRTRKPHVAGRTPSRRTTTETGRIPMRAAFFVMATMLCASAGANAYLAYQNTRSNFLQEVEKKRSTINDDMVNEMLWTRLNTYDQNQMEIARMQGYQEGINSLVHKIDPQQSQISNIWHAGYNRGLEQSNFMEEIGYEKGFSKGVDRGREEYMKAINNILTGKEDVKSAIKEFAEKYKPEEQKASDSTAQTGK